MPEPAGELYVSITGDISALLSALQQGEDAAKAAGEAIAHAIDVGAADASFRQLGESAQAMGEQAKQAGAELQAASDSTAALSDNAQRYVDQQEKANEAVLSAKAAVEELSGAMEAGRDVGDALARAEEDLTQATEKANPALKEQKDAAEEAETGLRGMGEQLAAIGEALVITEGLKEFGLEALNASDNITRATISLTALKGSGAEAKTTIEELEKLGIADGLSFPTLLTAGQRMVNFLGAGAPVPELLAKIADGAAVAQSDISNASNAFDRMATAGTASSRTLMPLGLTLQNVADAMNATGVASDMTADRAAKAFKALDQSERVDVLSTALDRLKGIAQDTAEATFGGQWQTLANQWEGVMKEVGDALLPVIKDLTDLAKNDVIPFIKELADGFNSMPEPARESVVALGLLIAALVPLTAATGAFVIGLGGLELLLPRVTALLEGFGANSAIVATEETAAATATEALGVAATGASTAMGGILGALIQFSPLLLGAGAAIIATTEHITELKNRYVDLDTEIRNHQILDAINAGKTVEDLNKLGISLDQIKNAVGGLNTQLEKSGPLSVDLGVKITVLADGMDSLSKNAQSYVDKQELANQTVAAAKAAMIELQGAQDGTTLKAEALQRATVAYDAALKAAEPTIKTHKDSLETLQAALAKAQQTFQDTKTILDQTVTAYQNGKVNIDLLEQAYTKVESAAKSAGTTFSDVTIQAQLLTRQVQGQYAALTTAVEVYQKLKDGTIPGSQAAIAEALAKVDEAAKKVGISVTQVGDGLKFVTDGANNAKGPVADLANTLNGLAGVQQDGVIVNGKWVATLQQGTDATGTATGAFQVFKGAADDLNSSLDNLNTTMVYTDGQLQTAADFVKQLNQAWDDAATAATNAAIATVDATDGISGQLVKVTNAGKSGKGGTGGGSGMSGIQFFEDIASVLNSPLASAQGSFTSNDLNNLATQIGLFNVGNNQFSTTDPNLKAATTQLQSASTSIGTASTTLSTGSTQLQTASAALTSAATTNTTSSAVIQQAATALTGAAVGLLSVIPGAGSSPGAGSISGPAIRPIGIPTMPGVPSSGAIGELTTSSFANAGPVIHLTITGNTISNQAAADQLATTMINKLRNQAGLKLTGF